LREENEFRPPKPMVEVGGGRPISSWQYHEKLMPHLTGYRDFILLPRGIEEIQSKSIFLNYEAMNNDFKAIFISRSGLGAKSHRLRYSWACIPEQDFTYRDTRRHGPSPRVMTGGRVRKIQKYVDGDTFLAYLRRRPSGDVDLHRLLDFHRELTGSSATVTTSSPPSPGSAWVEFNRREPRAQGSPRKPKSDGWMKRRLLSCFQREVFDYLGGDDCIFGNGRTTGASSLRRGSSWRFRHEKLLLRHGHLPGVSASKLNFGARVPRLGRYGIEPGGVAGSSCF